MPPPARLLILLCALILSGCNKNSNPTNYTVGPPKLEDLLGTYVPTQRTHELLKSTGKYPNSDSSITLNKNGSVTISNVPDWWLTSYSDAKGQFDNGSGTWTLDKNKDWWLIVLSFTTQHGQFTTSVPGRGHITAMLSLVGQKPPYVLQLSITDPNADVAMQYQKVKE
jgi:hypothetical protein